MSIGALARSMLGDRTFRVAGRAYRAVFVDLEREIRTLADEIPPYAHLLDVGGGDGEPLDRLLQLRSDIRVTTIDVAPRVGQWISTRHDGRVSRHGGTTLAAFLASDPPLPDVLLLADVLHHVPLPDRPGLLATVAKLFGRCPSLRLIVKDVEPGHWRSRLGYLSDRYVTGDRNVAPVSRSVVIEMVTRACNGVGCRETPLYRLDPPNYALVFEREASTA